MKIAGTGTKGAPCGRRRGPRTTDIEPQGIAVDPMGNNAISFGTFGPQDLGGGDLAFAGSVDMAYGGYGAGGNYLFGNLYGGREQDFGAGSPWPRRATASSPAASAACTTSVAATSPTPAAVMSSSPRSTR